MTGETNLNRRRWLLLLLLAALVLVLAGCGAPQGGVEDVNAWQPQGFWQSFVVAPLARALVWIDVRLQGMGVPYHWGFTIILFTILIKIVTLPLTISQMRGMKAQKEIQPKIQALQKQYGNDRNKLAAEQMKLYQEAGVNPLSGCLPLLIQMPILFGLYAAMVTIGPYLQDAAFFFIPDLSFPTAQDGLSWIMEGFRSGAIGTTIAYLVLPILLMVTQFAMQKWMTPAPAGGDQQAKTTQQITLVMTFTFGFFTLSVPAGLTLYWVTSNLLQMLQQWFMMRGEPAPATATPAEGKAALTDGANGAGKPATVEGKVVKTSAKNPPKTTPKSAAKSASGSTSGGQKRKGSK
jgi:YidC/Oxa1 family membrane protein insertase